MSALRAEHVTSGSAQSLQAQSMRAQSMRASGAAGSQPAVTQPGQASPWSPGQARPHLTALPGKKPALPLGRGQVGNRADRRFEAVRAPLYARSSVPFLALCAVILTAAMAMVLVLNTQMAYGAYEIARLGIRQTQASQDVQVAVEELRLAQASLPARAAEIGMVPAHSPQALDITAALPLLAGMPGVVVPADAAGQGDAGSDVDSSHVDSSDGDTSDAGTNYAGSGDAGSGYADGSQAQAIAPTDAGGQ